MQLFDVVPWGQASDYPADEHAASDAPDIKVWKRQQQKLDKLLNKTVVLPSKRTT